MNKKIIDIDIEFDNLKDGFFDEANINKRTANIEKNKTQYMREKVSAGNKGKTRTDQSKQKMSKAQKESCAGKIPIHLFDPEIHKKAIEKQKGQKRPITSQKLKGQTSKLKGKRRPELSKKLKGIPKSEEHKMNMRKPKIKSKCPYCHFMFAPNIMSRFHGDNCKQK